MFFRSLFPCSAEGPEISESDLHQLWGGSHRGSDQGTGILSGSGFSVQGSADVCTSRENREENSFHSDLQTFDLMTQREFAQMKEK